MLPFASRSELGSALAWYGGRFADRFMYGMAGSDPATIALVVCAILGSGLLAASLPARRALRIDPVTSLRSE